MYVTRPWPRVCLVVFQARLWAHKLQPCWPQVISLVCGSVTFVELSKLLASNPMSSEPEPQLLFDGHLVFTSTSKKTKKQIKDIVSWMEAFAIFSLVLATHFPHRWKDFCQYQLRILPPYHQFGNCVWLAYDRACPEPAAATNFVNWSEINVQLFNFCAAGVSACGQQDWWNRTEPSGLSLMQIIYKSWNRGPCSAPNTNFHLLISAQAVLPPWEPPRETTKHRSSSSVPSLPGSKSKRSWSCAFLFQISITFSFCCTHFTLSLLLVCGWLSHSFSHQFLLDISLTDTPPPPRPF